jgi:LemA protein
MKAAAAVLGVIVAAVLAVAVLQVQLEGTENRIAVERRDFNSTAQGYNTAIRKIPANFVAGMGGFRERPYFQADETAQKAPQVKF